MNKRARVHPSYVLRLAVFGGSIALLTWQGGEFPLPTLADMLPVGIARPVKPFLPVVPRRWRLPVSARVLPSQTRVVKVRLFEDQPVRTLVVSSVNGLKIGRRVFKGSLTIRQNNRGVIVLQGSRIIARDSVVEFQPVSKARITLRISFRTKRTTVGSVRVAALSNGLEVVNRLDLEDYVLGTVEPELGSMNLPVEAIKAQIIASRSYVLALHDRHPGKDYDFCDTAHCLMFAGVHAYPPRFLKAAEESRGLYLSYKGHPAAAFFHHSCGGETAAVEDVWSVPAVPYLRRVVDGTPAHCRFDRQNAWNFTMDRTALQKCFGTLTSLDVIRKDAGDRARQIVVQSATPRRIDANQFRRMINHYYRREVLLSTQFTITQTGDRFRFEGRGWGHGVGMCQAGAIQMARDGKTVADILAHYYPGTQIKTLSTATKPALKPDSAVRKYFSTVSE